MRVGHEERIERMFSTDARWLGGDGAGSVGLSGGRRLWLFGDTFVADSPGGSRATSTLIHNSIAIQRDNGAGPAMTFHWRVDDDGSPRSFFTDPEPDTYIWPGHAASIGGRLLVFLMRIRRRIPGRVQALTGFSVVGWSAVMVDEPTGDPLGWTLRPVAHPPAPGMLLVGSGGVFVDGGHLHAHAVPDRVRGAHRLVRWRVDAAVNGDLTAPSWWCGRRGWCPAGVAAPVGVARPALTEFTVHRVPATRRLLRVELVGLLRPRLRLRWAQRPEGPWSRPVTILVPPQAERKDVFCYAAKAHPGLGDGRGLVITYNSNTREPETLVDRGDLYRPHALRVDPG